MPNSTMWLSGSQSAPGFSLTDLSLFCGLRQAMPSFPTRDRIKDEWPVIKDPLAVVARANLLVPGWHWLGKSSNS